MDLSAPLELKIRIESSRIPYHQTINELRTEVERHRTIKLLEFTSNYSEIFCGCNLKPFSDIK